MEAQLPDSIWMKIFVTETEVEVELDDLVSDGVLVPHEEVETETEWELLEGGVMSELEEDAPEPGKTVVRRYEFYKYTGPYSDEHEPTAPPWDGVGDAPPTAGAFIAANMVAVNLIPEPASVGLALSGAGLCLLALRRRERK